MPPVGSAGSRLKQLLSLSGGKLPLLGDQLLRSDGANPFSAGENSAQFVILFELLLCFSWSCGKFLEF